MISEEEIHLDIKTWFNYPGSRSTEASKDFCGLVYAL